jgi:hypothetical protein
MTAPKVTRGLDNLVATLRQERDKLFSFGHLAFRENKAEYLGEVAGKLRLLACSTRTNRPLLLDLADEFGIALNVTVGGPEGWTFMSGQKAGDVLPLREWIDTFAFSCQTSAGQVQLTKRQLILIWASQQGGAHQDWELNEEFVMFRQAELIRIGNRDISAHWLKEATTLVGQLTDLTLRQLTPERVAQHAANR